MTRFSELWRGALLLVALAPLAYYALASIAALRFFRRVRGEKLADFTPPVSVLKPVHGTDFGTYENFASFCRQDYPDYEILFAVNDEKDAAIPVIRRIEAEFPQRKIRLFIGAEYLGANQKVNNLARLTREAKHEILVLSDGDVRVGPHYLREVAAPFANQETGAVTSFYRSIAEKSFGAELEAVGAASDFFAGVLMADWLESVKFALGASIATTKSWVAKIGGFEGIAGLLADDYELGNRIAKAGGKIVLSRETVWTMYPAQTVRGFWEHQVRWARTVRLCRPMSYFGLIFTLGLPWGILAAIVALPLHPWVAAAFLLAYLSLRLTVAWTVGVWGVGDEVLRRKLWIIPLRDAIHFIVWLGGFASNRVRWSGKEYTIKNGKMVPVPTEESPVAKSATTLSS
jgi:ceramide glucosyltransferase